MHPGLRYRLRQHVEGHPGRRAATSDERRILEPVQARSAGCWRRDARDLVHGARRGLPLPGAPSSVRTKANGVIKLLGPIAVVLLATFVIFGNVLYPAANNHNLGSGASIAMWVTGLLAVAAAGFAVLMHSESGVQRRENLAFLGTGVAIILLFVTIFIKMFGTLGFAPTAGTNFDMWIAASSPATLRLMSFAALVGVPNSARLHDLELPRLPPPPVRGEYAA